MKRLLGNIECEDKTKNAVIRKSIWEHYLADLQLENIEIDATKEDAKNIWEQLKKYIEEKGYGKYFVHSLGHGVGLDVHEPPTLGPLSNEILSSGNVVTVEPGIYIPGFGGVRIEDTVLIHENKAIKLTDIGN